MSVSIKRMWFMFNEETCELESYANESEFKASKTPLQLISISRATIVPDTDKEREFRIL